ncbi:MAG: glycosyltransferase family 39 protein [Acidobacteriota bacterium]
MLLALRQDRPAALAALAALALFLGLAIFGARFHWVEEAGTAERDGYVAQADQILAGNAPVDAFRPPLYPYAIAALGRLTGDTFGTARLLSNLSAAALAWLAFAFGRRLAGDSHGGLAGALAMALVAANPSTWILGQHVTTDMPFAALAGAALLAGLAYLERPSTTAALCAGLAYGAAACTRGNAVLILPGLLAAWWLSARSERGGGRELRRTSHLAAAALLAAAVLTPHWILRAHLFGSALYDENWKNLLWKLHGYPDWSKLAAIPAGGSFGQILRSEPGAVIAGAGSELWRLIAGGLAQLLGTPLHVLAAAAGAALCVRRHSRPAIWLLATLALFTFGVATAFFAWGRFLLILLPAAAACTAAGALSLDLDLPRRRVLAAVAAALVAVLAVKTAVFRLPAFIELHPYADVAALQGLERQLPPGQGLAGTSPFLERYLAHSYLAIPDAFGEQIAMPALYLDTLIETLRKRRVAFLVADAIDLRDRPRALLGEGAPPPGLELVSRAAGVTTWRVTLEPPKPGTRTVP